MIRLSSYSVYLWTFIAPVFFIGLINFIITNNDSIYFALFFLPVLTYWGYLIYQSRRIYYKDGELYLYNLFSKKFVVVKKDKFGSIDKSNTSLLGNTGTYKLTYYDDENNAKYVFFSINNFIDNAEEIINKLNEID